jgi:hypothetical protein
MLLFLASGPVQASLRLTAYINSPAAQTGQACFQRGGMTRGSRPVELWGIRRLTAISAKPCQNPAFGDPAYGLQRRFTA